MVQWTVRACRVGNICPACLLELSYEVARYETSQNFWSKPVQKKKRKWGHWNALSSAQTCTISFRSRVVYGSHPADSTMPFWLEHKPYGHIRIIYLGVYRNADLILRCVFDDIRCFQSCSSGCWPRYNRELKVCGAEFRQRPWVMPGTKEEAFTSSLTLRFNPHTSTPTQGDHVTSDDLASWRNVSSLNKMSATTSRLAAASKFKLSYTDCIATCDHSRT